MTHPRHYTPLTCAVVAALAVLGLLAGPAAAAPGDLDANFGAGGRVVTDVSPGGNDSARAVAVQPDGKVVVAVRDRFSLPPASALLRYQRDGRRLDSSFGTGGKVSTTYTAADGTIQGFNVEDIAIQSDGKIVVAGRGFVVARYLADGSVDTAFGTGGSVISRFPNLRPDFAPTSDAERIAVQADGKIVVAGDKCETNFGRYDRAIAVARYTPDGTPDTTFSSDGLAQVDAGGAVDATFCTDESRLNGNEKTNGMALQGDGKIVVAIGRGSYVAGNRDFFVVRLLASGPSAGGLDTGFGLAGLVNTDVRGDDVARDVAIQNGKIVVAGSATDATGGGFAVVRYREEDGSLDSSFGSGGKLVTDSGALSGKLAQGMALGVQDDGKLVVAGCTLSCGADSDFALARYQRDGALDQGFGSAGTLTTVFPGGASFASDLAIDPADQSLLVAGGMRDIGDTDTALARYTAKTADLSLTASASPDPSTVGQPLSYTLTVTNRGPDVARSVTLSDLLSTRVGYASSATTQGTCSPEPDERSVSCALGALELGASATVQIVVTANATGRATNSASVSSATTDADQSNNSTTVISTIAATIAAASAPPPPSAPPSAPPSPLSAGLRVSGFGLTNNPFVVGSRSTPASGVAAKANRHKTGTTFRYTLSEAARVKIVISRRLSGRRRGTRCVAPTRKLRNASKCTRLSVKGTLTRTSRKGANRIAFSGRIGSKALTPGRYQARLTATDAAKKTSKPKTISFTIVRR